MRNIRGIIALSVSLLIAFLVAAVVYRRVSRPPMPTPTPVVKSEPEPVTRKIFSETIPPGMRAFSVKIDQVAGLPDDIKKQDRVDIVATSPLPENKGDITRVILQNVEILDIDRVSADKTNGQRQRDRQWTISLLVTPDQGVTLAAATASSRIMLLTRNRSDNHQVDTSPTAFTPESGIKAIDLDMHSRWKNAIPAGMRAITVAVRDTDGIAGQLEKGDRVDVLLSCANTMFKGGSDPGSKGTVTNTRQMSRIVLQNIEILATEKEASLDAGLPEPVRLITLLVSPPQAETVAVMTDTAKGAAIRLINRHAGDHETVGTRGQLLSDLFPYKTGKKEYRIKIYRGSEKPAERYILE
jgi:Flp pilus assembly protein CpaB